MIFLKWVKFFHIGKSKMQIFDQSNIKITFKDVAGMEEAKNEI